jgi:hypothetical protein
MDARTILATLAILGTSGCGKTPPPNAQGVPTDAMSNSAKGGEQHPADASTQTATTSVDAEKANNAGAIQPANDATSTQDVKEITSGTSEAKGGQGSCAPGGCAPGQCGGGKDSDNKANDERSPAKAGAPTHK